jgi:hypothetical protein
MNCAAVGSNPVRIMIANQEVLNTIAIKVRNHGHSTREIGSRLRSEHFGTDFPSAGLLERHERERKEDGAAHCRILKLISVPSLNSLNPV